MLYKNDEPYKLDPQDIKTLRAEFHDKFPVKVVYPPERVVKSRSKHNRLPDQPNSISFDFVAEVRQKKGAQGQILQIPTEIWRYAVTRTTDKNGNFKYSPKKFSFKGKKFLTESDIEQIYFLKKKSEYCKGGDNEGRITKFMFEDLVTEAEKKFEKKRNQAKIDALLYGERKLPVKRLREVAKALFIKDVDGLSDAQVSIAIETKITSKKDGLDQFFSMIDADVEIKSRKSIQDAIDSGKLFYDSSKRSWYWKTDQKKPEFICKVVPGGDAPETLVELYIGDKSFRSDVNAFLMTGKKDAGKNADDDENTGGNEGGGGNEE